GRNVVFGDGHEKYYRMGTTGPEANSWFEPTLNRQALLQECPLARPGVGLGVQLLVKPQPQLPVNLEGGGILAPGRQGLQLLVPGVGLPKSHARNQHILRRTPK